MWVFFEIPWGRYLVWAGGWHPSWGDLGKVNFEAKYFKTQQGNLLKISSLGSAEFLKKLFL
jgi:hypothetical protein